MNLTNGTGVQYPTIVLGDKTYTIKFGRAMLYRMDKLGVKFLPTIIPPAGDRPGVVNMNFSQIVDVMHIAIGFQGTHEELAELVYEQRNEAVTALMVAWGKAFPPKTPVLTAETQPAQPEIQ